MAVKRKRFNDDFRASAVLMLEATGYPEKKGGLTQVSNHLGVPLSTLRGWYTEEHNPAPAEVRNVKRIDLVGELTNLLGLTFTAAQNTVEEASYKELATAIGIFVDKLQLLSGQPTERQELNVIDHRERILAVVARKSGGHDTDPTHAIYQQPIG